MRGSRDSAAPAVTVTGDDIDDAVGKPAAWISSPSRNALSGVSSAGFNTTVQPVASAGASFHAAISSGKFHGMIAPTTPTQPLCAYR